MLYCLSYAISVLNNKEMTISEYFPQLQSNGVTTSSTVLYGSLDRASHTPLIPDLSRIHAPSFVINQICHVTLMEGIPILFFHLKYLQMLKAMLSPGCTLTGVHNGKYNGNQLNILCSQTASECVCNVLPTSHSSYIVLAHVPLCVAVRSYGQHLVSVQSTFKVSTDAMQCHAYF